MNSIQYSDVRNLTAVHDDTWASLERSVSDRNCGWRLPVLATQENHRPRQRTVVLRRVSPSIRTIYAHTDLRSPKVAQVRNTAEVSWLFYDHANATQLILTGMATVHTDDSVAQNFWEDEPVASLRGYLAPHSPGQPTVAASHNLPETLIGKLPDREQLADARRNFGVISCRIASVEWLHLQRDGNLRAVFRYEGAAASEKPTNTPDSSEWLHP